MKRSEQPTMINLDRGLFLIRYAAAEDEFQPPIVKVSVVPSSNKNLRFFLHPDHDEAVLWEPDTSLVVRASAPGSLAVQIEPLEEGGSLVATVRIESLRQGAAAHAPSNAGTVRGTNQRDQTGLRILGHVSERGDVDVGANEWIAGPTAPLRIEGVSLDWPDKPEDIEIRYAVKTARPHFISGLAVGLGAFAGTRGNAMPIIAIMLQIEGRAAANFQFNVETIFLGAPIKRSVGQRIVMSGPTGKEPLVGLRLNIEQVGNTRQRPDNEPPAKKSLKPSDRVRVFRSHTKSKQRTTV